ncbi:hypothetical protein [Flavisolibacter tropicus]|nr:hypothetical protein [Flavisolibacter tropicus]
MMKVEVGKIRKGKFEMRKEERRNVQCSRYKEQGMMNEEVEERHKGKKQGTRKEMFNAQFSMIKVQGRRIENRKALP